MLCVVPLGSVLVALAEWDGLLQQVWRRYQDEDVGEWLQYLVVTKQKVIRIGYGRRRQKLVQPQ